MANVEEMQVINECPICGHSSTLLYSDLPDRLIPDSDSVWNLLRCERCGHVWQSPRVTPEEIGLLYQGYSDIRWTKESSLRPNSWLLKMRRGYLTRRFGSGNDLTKTERLLGYVPYIVPGYRRMFDRRVKWLSAPPGRLLDVGSGDGDFLALMRDLGWGVHGVDTDSVSVEKARSRGVEVDCGVLLEQGYDSDQFDAITMSHVIEHLHDPVEVLKECRRILKKDGVLVILTPNIQSLGHQYFGSSWQPLEQPRHLNLFSTTSITRAISDAGLTPVHVWTAYDLVVVAPRWLNSYEIVDHGSYRPIKPRRMSRLRLGGKYLVQRIKSGMRSDAGEEIVAICRKQ